MHKSQNSQNDPPKPGAFRVDEDLSSLLTSVSEQAENADRSETGAGATAPEESLSELLEAIEGETQSAATGPIDAPTDRPGDNRSAPVAPSGLDTPARPHAGDERAPDTADLSEAPLGDATFPDAARDAADASDSPAPGKLASGVAHVLRAESARYLSSAKAIVEQVLVRADNALDALHPRARDAVGVAGIGMLALAFVLFLTELLGWI